MLRVMEVCILVMGEILSVVSSMCNLYRLMVQGVVELPVQSEGGETRLTVITMCD